MIRMTLQKGKQKFFYNFNKTLFFHLCPRKKKKAQESTEEEQKQKEDIDQILFHVKFVFFRIKNT